MKDCEMCGRSAYRDGQYRWFQYDNGEVARIFCCVGCLLQHDLLSDSVQLIPVIAKKA